MPQSQTQLQILHYNHFISQFIFLFLFLILLLLHCFYVSHLLCPSHPGIYPSQLPISSRLSCNLSPCSSSPSFPFVLFFPSVTSSFSFSLSVSTSFGLSLFSSMLSSHSFFSFFLIRSFSFIVFIHFIILTLPSTFSQQHFTSNYTAKKFTYSSLFLPASLITIFYTHLHYSASFSSIFSQPPTQLPVPKR
ncbi:unnamed protein product [Acanthosepion pharaonis]|uniref:Uncharacterized protein n=1 Tax=Acanthosepion pharaonis TaxID=158019 RepID=A0A812DKX1_ACAPH|nr:unnamed protein product [Sepia pharaonis]